MTLGRRNYFLCFAPLTYYVLGKFSKKKKKKFRKHFLFHLEMKNALNSTCYYSVLISQQAYLVNIQIYLVLL